jgi:hypothetical protein
MKNDWAADEIMEGLDELLSAKDRLVCAEIDAGCCQTRLDYEHKRTCEDEYWTAREAFEKLVRDVLDRERRYIQVTAPKPKKTG